MYIVQYEMYVVCLPQIRVRETVDLEYSSIGTMPKDVGNCLHMSVCGVNPTPISNGNIAGL